MKNAAARHWPSSIRTCIAAGLLLFAGSVLAYQAPTGTPDESDLNNHNTYQNRDGETVHAPAHSRSGKVPEGATAHCRDGSYSFSRHRSGTCSRHGGVESWL
jgi:hypothetical protein